MVRIFQHEHLKNYIYINYSEKLYVRDSETASSKFDQITANMKNLTIILNYTDATGLVDKDYVLHMATRGFQFESRIKEVATFGIKKIFFYLYKLAMTITTARQFKRLYFKSAEEIETNYSINLSEFKLVFSSKEIKENSTKRIL